MGWVTEASVRQLLEHIRTPEQGGYAALVFVVSRAEGDGMVHQRHLEDWSGIHDLTSRHVAVITPDPRSIAVVDDGVAIRGVSLFGSGAVRAVDAGSWPRPASYAPKLPRPVREHAAAVTTAATQLQEYFGLAEELLPCAVIVCTREREVVVAGLSHRVTVYGLLKHVKSALEPALARLNQAMAELKDHGVVSAPLAAERDRARAELSAARHRASTWDSAVAAQREWSERRTVLATELAALAVDVDADTAALFRWLAARLADDRALDDRETSRAEALFTTLSSRVGNLPSRERRSMSRRVRRTVARLGTGVAVVPAKPDDDLDRLEAQLARCQAAYEATLPEHQARAAKVAAARHLEVLGAVRFAVSRLGLRQSSSGLLPWRETAWPVTAFVPPPGRVPSVRTGRE